MKKEHVFHAYSSYCYTFFIDVGITRTVSAFNV